MIPDVSGERPSEIDSYLHDVLRLHSYISGRRVNVKAPRGCEWMANLTPWETMARSRPVQDWMLTTSWAIDKCGRMARQVLIERMLRPKGVKRSLDRIAYDLRLSERTTRIYYSEARELFVAELWRRPIPRHYLDEFTERDRRMLRGEDVREAVA